jgi:SAM-dependent methyltransferase
MQDITQDLAELYDLDCGEIDEDIPFYQSLAKGTHGSILELGVGTGRVAVPLAAAGNDVWGLDASASMLARARCNADARGVSLHVVEGRMEQFQFEERFGLIYAAFGTLHHLLTKDALLACLNCVATHLQPGGVFACDLRPLHFEDWEEGDSTPLFHDWTRPNPRTGETVMKFRTVQNDPTRQLKRETAFFDVLSNDGALRRFVQETELRYFSRAEIEASLGEAGLRLDGVYGGYAGEEYADDGNHLIVIARTLETA